MKKNEEALFEITTSKAIDEKVGRDLQELYNQINLENVPSGVLNRTIFPHLEIEKFDGSPSSPGLNQATWEQFYFDLYHGAVGTSALPPLFENKKKWLDKVPENAIPLAILDVNYEALRPEFLALLKKNIEEKKAIELPSNKKRAVKSEHYFGACLLLPRKYDNFRLLDFVYDELSFDIYLDPDLYFTNHGNKPDFITINMNDGKGVQRMNWEEAISVQYDQAMEQSITLNAHFADGSEQSSHLIFKMEESQPEPAPNETWTLSGRAENGGLIHGTAWVWYGKGNTQLTKPMIMAEGFPGGYTRRYLYNAFNQQNMLERFRQKQYDFIIVSFKHGSVNNGSGKLEDSAMLMVNAISQAIEKRNGNEKLVVGGASMGGLVSRYALTYMEKNNIPHETKHFVTFDSPHKGAYIPVANQWFLRMFVKAESSAREGVALISTMAAKQMLIYYISGWNIGQRSLVSQDHTDFFNKLRGLGNYPDGPRKLAIADGRGDGKLQEAEGAPLRWSYKFETIFVWANLINMPHLKSNFETVARGYHNKIDFWHSYYINVRNTISYDGAPGGFGDTTKQIADGFDKVCSVGSTLYFGNPCFIPTISALDINSNDPWVDISKLPRESSAFDNFIYNTTNIAHVALTGRMRDWLERELQHSEVNVMA